MPTQTVGWQYRSDERRIMPLKATYISQARPVWPLTMERVARIYNTIGRAIHKPNASQKADLLKMLLAIGYDLDANFLAITANQGCFAAWVMRQIASLQPLPFCLTDSAGNALSRLPFGAAQKFVNLIVKDWWAVSPHATAARSAVLHGMLDQIVYTATSRYCAVLPSLLNRKGVCRSYVYHLTAADYVTYQGHLDIVANRLSAGLHLPRTPHRIEIEQLLWGWI